MADKQSARLFVFVHLPKSAGTTLTHHFKKNLQKNQWLNIYPKSLNIDEFQPEKIPAKLKQVFKNKSSDNIKYVFGHTMFKGVEKLISSPKKPFYLTFLRDPAKRIVSLYNYYSGWYWRDPAHIRDKKELYHRILLINSQYPDFWDWYTQVFKPADHKIELTTITKYYQRLGYLDNGKLSAKKIKDFLHNFDFIGTTETFGDDALYLYGLNNFHKFFIDQNISDKFFKLSDHPEIEKRLKADLTDDYRLFEAVKTHHQQYLKSHPKYYQTVNKVKSQQSWLLPFTQLLFDWPNNLRYTSSYLRKILPIYGKIKDQLIIFF